MNNKNTMSKGYYVFLNVFWSIVAVIMYQDFHFRSVLGISYSASKAILWIMILTAVLFGVLITWRHRRNHLSVFVNVTMPFEIYTIITYSHNLPKLIWIVISMAVLLSGLYSMTQLMPLSGFYWTRNVCGRMIRNQTRRKEVISKRVVKSTLGSRTITACCLSFVILYLVVSMFFGGILGSSTVAAENTNALEEITIANNIDVLSNLLEYTWYNLSAHERLDTLQTVANIESYYLGLPHELNVKIGKLSESTLAIYNDRTHSIIIDINHFDYAAASEVLNSVCHEAFHAYQSRLCDVFDSVDEKYRSLLIFNDVQYYKLEFSNYITAKDDANNYFLQRCEIDARAYAENAVTDYYKKIITYLVREEP